MDRTFTDVIFETLQQMGLEILSDPPRFLACVQDLGAGFEDEKKFMKRGFDQKFLDICSEAAQCSAAELDPVQKRAEEYLKREYLMADEWAETISEAMVQGIGWYVHPERRNADRLRRSVEMQEEETVLDERQARILSGEPLTRPQPQAFSGGQNFASGSAGSGSAGQDYSAGQNIYAGQGYSAGQGGSAGQNFSAGQGYSAGAMRPQMPAPAPARKKLPRWAFICLAVILGFGIGAIAFVATGDPEDEAAQTQTQTETAAEAPAAAETPVDISEVEKLDYDIDFSQLKSDDDAMIGSPSVAGVNIFMKVANHSATTVLRSVEFKFSQNGKEISNIEGGSFRAYGWIEPGQTGYMLGHMVMADETIEAKDRQGEIELTRVAAYGKPSNAPDYVMTPGGEILDHDEDTDTYITAVENTCGYPVSAKTSYLLVYWDNEEDFDEIAWGAGKLQKDLAPGGAYKDDTTIYNPGWRLDGENKSDDENTAYDDYKNFEVYIIDTQYLR